MEHIIAYNPYKNGNKDFKRDELIRKIEHSVEQMTLSELEALSYDMFTKGYMEDY